MSFSGFNDVITGLHFDNDGILQTERILKAIVFVECIDGKSSNKHANENESKGSKQGKKGNRGKKGKGAKRSLARLPSQVGGMLKKDGQEIDLQSLRSYFSKLPHRDKLRLLTLDFDAEELRQRFLRLEPDSFDKPLKEEAFSKNLKRITERKEDYEKFDSSLCTNEHTEAFLTFTSDDRIILTSYFVEERTQLFFDLLVSSESENEFASLFTYFCRLCRICVCVNNMHAIWGFLLRSILHAAYTALIDKYLSSYLAKQSEKQKAPTEEKSGLTQEGERKLIEELKSSETSGNSSKKKPKRRKKKKGARQSNSPGIVTSSEMDNRSEIHAPTSKRDESESSQEQPCETSSGVEETESASKSHPNSQSSETDSPKQSSGREESKDDDIGKREPSTVDKSEEDVSPISIPSEEEESADHQQLREMSKEILENEERISTLLKTKEDLEDERREKIDQKEKQSRKVQDIQKQLEKEDETLMRLTQEIMSTEHSFQRRKRSIEREIDGLRAQCKTYELKKDGFLENINKNL